MEWDDSGVFSFIHGLMIQRNNGFGGRYCFDFFFYYYCCCSLIIMMIIYELLFQIKEIEEVKW